MAFKYQALNDSRSSLTSLSSLGSSRSIDSSAGSSRQRPRLEFSAAGSGTTTITTNRNQIGMAEERSTPCTTRAVRGEAIKGESEGIHLHSVISSQDDTDSNECFGSCGRGEVLVSGLELGRERRVYNLQSSTEHEEAGHKERHDGSNDTTLLQQRDSCGFIEASAHNKASPLQPGVESETGLYIHSSVRSSRSSGVRFSRQSSSLGRQNGPILNQPRGGTLFKVLQRFSTKRAQQRVDWEAEKRARKSLRHHGRTETGREKENLSHNNKRSHKQGKTGHFPVSKSNDQLFSSGGFSDVVCHDSASELDDSTSASSEKLLLNDDLSSSVERNGRESHDVNRYHGQQYLGMVDLCGGDAHDLYSTSKTTHSNDSSSKYRVPVRRTNSLNENIHYDCTHTERGTAMPARTGGTIAKATGHGASLRNSNLGRDILETNERRKGHLSFNKLKRRHSPDAN